MAKSRAVGSATASASIGRQETFDQIRKYLGGVWAGSKGETYEILFGEASCWSSSWPCVRRDEIGNMTYTLKWNGDDTLIWGTDYCLLLSELRRTGGKQPTWHSAKGKRPFFWCRVQGNEKVAEPSRRLPMVPPPPAPRSGLAAPDDEEEAWDGRNAETFGDGAAREERLSTSEDWSKGTSPLGQSGQAKPPSFSPAVRAASGDAGGAAEDWSTGFPGLSPLGQSGHAKPPSFSPAARESSAGWAAEDWSTGLPGVSPLGQSGQAELPSFTTAARELIGDADASVEEQAGATSGVALFLRRLQANNAIPPEFLCSMSSGAYSPSAEAGACEGGTAVQATVPADKSRSCVRPPPPNISPDEAELKYPSARPRSALEKEDAFEMSAFAVAAAVLDDADGEVPKFRPGSQVRAMFFGEWYNGSVREIHRDTVQVVWDGEHSTMSNVPIGDVVLRSLSPTST